MKANNFPVISRTPGGFFTLSELIKETLWVGGTGFGGGGGGLKLRFGRSPIVQAASKL